MTFRKYGRALERADLPADTNAVVGCYSTDVYCVHPNHQRDEGERLFIGDVAPYPMAFTGETRGDTLRAARKQGWYISRDKQRVLCPYHAKQVPR